MSFAVKTWLDRMSAHPNRRTFTNPNDNTDVHTYDVTRAEGNVTQEGSPMNAAAMNDLESRIQAMNTSLVGTPITVTLPASAWNSETHLITVNVIGVTAASNQEIFGLPAIDAASVQNNTALQAANIMDYSQAVGSITLYAEKVPTIDLQVNIIVRS